MEFPYRPAPQFELRAADVVIVSHSRADAVDPDDNLHGAPDLVIEIKSPSNRPGKRSALASLCLNNGAREFWVFDMEQKSITVAHRDGSTTVYQVGQSIPLSSFGGGSLAVEEIYAR